MLPDLEEYRDSDETAHGALLARPFPDVWQGVGSSV